jgi:hypothetical protein
MRSHQLHQSGSAPGHARDIWWTLDFANAFVSPGVNSRGELVPSHGASRRRLGDEHIWLQKQLLEYFNGNTLWNSIGFKYFILLVPITILTIWGSYGIYKGLLIKHTVVPYMKIFFKLGKLVTVLTLILLLPTETIMGWWRCNLIKDLISSRLTSF